jgi:protein TonB
MRERIAKAKAYIAVRNYNAAIYELESIRRETSDQSVQAVTNVLLMNSYLEQGDYKRAQDFLNQAYTAMKANKPNAASSYFAIAAQVVSGARSRVERYRALGLNVADRTLPLEAVNDLEKMRETVETVITQSKEASQDKSRSSDAMALLEEASTSRSMMARDDYDARRWQTEVGDAREQLASSRSVVLNATADGIPSSDAVAQVNPTPAKDGTITDAALRQPAYVPNPSNTTSSNPLIQKTGSSQPINQPPAAVNAERGTRSAELKPAGETPRDRVVAGQPAVKSAEPSNAESKTVAFNPVEKDKASNVAKTEPPKGGTQNAGAQTAVQNVSQPAVAAPVDKPKDDSPMAVGSLIGYATKQAQPTYPLAARTMRATGAVRVEVTIDENGQVAEVQSASGPLMLQEAAKEAVKKWHFKPFIRDGQPVKAVGFVTFNFSM